MGQNPFQGLRGLNIAQFPQIFNQQPVNSSGYVFRRNELELIARIAECHDFYVIADEICERIVFPEFISEY